MTIKFKDFRKKIEEQSQDSTLFFTFGRFNPPHNGHLIVMDKLKELAQGSDYRVYVSKTQDNKKNPLTHASKVKWLRRMFPQHGRQIVGDQFGVIFDILVKIYNQNYNNIVMVVGEDRVESFRKLILQYNGVQNRSGYYHFNKIEVVQAGSTRGVRGSATLQRSLAADNDFEEFKKGLPRNFPDAEELFDEIRANLKNTKENFNVPERKDLVTSDIFQPGTKVFCTVEKKVFPVFSAGTNYIVYMLEGKRKKRWPNQVFVLSEKTHIDRLKNEFPKLWHDFEKEIKGQNHEHRPFKN